MRAILKCKTSVEINCLESILTETEWWPPLDQQHESVQEHKREILNKIALEDQVIIEGTFLYMIYDNVTKTWGLITSPQQGLLEFRLSNFSADRIKMSCEKLVTEFQQLRYSNNSTKSKVDFRFLSPIIVLEERSEHNAFLGNVFPASRLTLAIKQEYAKFYAGILTAGFGLIGILIMIPPIQDSLYKNLTVDWINFWENIVNVLSISAFTSSLILLLTVFFHWIDIKDKPFINWTI